MKHLRIIEKFVQFSEAGLIIIVSCRLLEDGRLKRVKLHSINANDPIHIVVEALSAEYEADVVDYQPLLFMPVLNEDELDET